MIHPFLQFLAHFEKRKLFRIDFYKPTCFGVSASVYPMSSWQGMIEATAMEIHINVTERPEFDTASAFVGLE